VCDYDHLLHHGHGDGGAVRDQASRCDLHVSGSSGLNDYGCHESGPSGLNGCDCDCRESGRDVHDRKPSCQSS
jgi:hypothetical protein